MQPERLDKGDPGIFDARIGSSALPPLIGFEDHAHPLDADGHAVLDHDTGTADPGDVALGHHPREEVELAILPPRGRRIQNAFDLQRITGLGRHDRADPTQVVGHGDREFCCVHRVFPRGISGVEAQRSALDGRP